MVHTTLRILGLYLMVLLSPFTVIVILIYMQWRRAMTSTARFWEPLGDWSKARLFTESTTTTDQIFVNKTSASTVSFTEKSAVKLCRDRDKYMDPTTFRLKACAGCYRYLFPRKRIFAFYKDFYMVKVTENTVNGSVLQEYKHVIPEIYNRTSRSEICRTLNADECERWAHCCVEAIECCQMQVSSAPSSAGNCPKTWDGYSCWDEAERGTTVSLPCPTFLEHARPSVRAYKTCTVNVTWFAHESGLEWTNYTQCLDASKHKIVTYIKIACEAASLGVLIPAVAIFLSYRLLRKQHRIKLHVNLFSSFILTGVVYILWGTVVVLNRMEVPNRDTVMHQNSPGCKFLYAMTRYTRAANYIWVLCEGFYLHRLIVRAFEPPKSLIIYYILGWGFPFIPVGVYSILRTIYSDKNCWVVNFGAHEWLIYAPNLICLVLNLIFLCNILRILLTQLQSHPNEPSNYRRALKATFILIPLFGLQLTLIIYRPPFDSPVSHAYEIIAAIITHSQGFFVALIFCFLNGEVLTQLRKTWMNFRGKRRLREKRFESSTTQFTSEYNSRARNSTRSDKNYVAMKTVSKINGLSKHYA